MAKRVKADPEERFFGNVPEAPTASLLGCHLQTVRRGLIREALPIRRPGGSLPGHVPRTLDTMREYQATANFA